MDLSGLKTQTPQVHYLLTACVYSFFLREMAVKAKVEKPKTNFYVVNIELYPRPLETLRG